MDGYSRHLCLPVYWGSAGRSDNGTAKPETARRVRQRVSAASLPGEDPTGLWSVQLELLTLAEDILGPRDTSKVIYQPVFADGGPNLDGAFAELSRNAEGYWPTVVKELAHETVHLLNPKPGDGIWLSEGVAVAFSNYAQQQFKLEPQRVKKPSYRRALELASELPPGPLAAGRRIREACGCLDNASQSILETLFPSVDQETFDGALSTISEGMGSPTHYIKEASIMQKALHLRTTVLPGGKIEIVDQELPVGESVDVVVSQSSASERRSAPPV